MARVPAVQVLKLGTPVLTVGYTWLLIRGSLQPSSSCGAIIVTNLCSMSLGHGSELLLIPPISSLEVNEHYRIRHTVRIVNAL